jgi:hypothetical protein
MHIDPDALLMLELENAFAELEGVTAACIVVLLRIDALEETPVALIPQPVRIAIGDELFDSL